LNGQKKLKISNFVCQSYLRIFPWNFLTDHFPWKYQVLSARQNWNQRKKNLPPKKNILIGGVAILLKNRFWLI
jgi:hypothetical protein